MLEAQLKAKLTAHVKNIMTIVETPIPCSSKVMLIDSVQDHVNETLNELKKQYKINQK